MSDPDPGTHYPSASQSRSGQFVSIFGIERLLGVLLRHIIDLDRLLDVSCIFLFLAFGGCLELGHSRYIRQRQYNHFVHRHGRQGR